MSVRMVNFWLFVARRLVPKKLAYMCCIYVLAHSTTGKYSGTVAPELTAIEALKRFDNDFSIEGKASKPKK